MEELWTRRQEVYAVVGLNPQDKLLTFAVSTPRCIELDKDKFIALDDLVKVLGSEHADALVLGHLGAQAKRGYGKQTDQTLHLSLFVTDRGVI